MRTRKPQWRIVKPVTLSDAFTYDKVTGVINRRVVRRCISHNLPDQVTIDQRPIGTLHPTGYMVTSLNSDQWYLNRLAWALATGEEPDGRVRHINGDRLDNRFDNLTLINRRK